MEESRIPIIDTDELSGYFEATGKALQALFNAYAQGDYSEDLVSRLEGYVEEIDRRATPMKSIDMVARQAGAHARIVGQHRQKTVDQVRAHWQLCRLLGPIDAEKIEADAKRVLVAINVGGERWNEARTAVEKVASEIGKSSATPAQAAAFDADYTKAARDYTDTTEALCALLSADHGDGRGDADHSGFHPNVDYADLWPRQRPQSAEEDPGWDRGHRSAQLAQAAAQVELRQNLLTSTKALSMYYTSNGESLRQLCNEYHLGNYRADDLLIRLKALVVEIGSIASPMQSIEVVALHAGRHAPVVNGREGKTQATRARVRAHWQLGYLTGRIIDGKKVEADAKSVMDAIESCGGRWNQADKELREVSQEIGKAAGSADQAVELRARYSKAVGEYETATLEIRDLLTARRGEARATGAGAQGQAAADARRFDPKNDYESMWEVYVKRRNAERRRGVTPNGKRIKAARKAKGDWSQEKLAKETVSHDRRVRKGRRGVALRTIRRVESGADVDLATMEVIAKTLGEDVKNLISKDEGGPKARDAKPRGGKAGSARGFAGMFRTWAIGQRLAGGVA